MMTIIVVTSEALGHTILDSNFPDQFSVSSHPYPEHTYIDQNA